MRGVGGLECFFSEGFSGPLPFPLFLLIYPFLKAEKTFSSLSRRG